MVKGISVSDFERVTQFYNERCRMQGYNIAAVGWKDRASQYLRFEMLFRDYDPQGKTILDVGCGFGDLVDYLTLHYGNNFHYIGIDVSSELIKEAKKRHSEKHCNFYQGDLFSFIQQKSTQNITTNSSIDYAVESGMLSFKIADNNRYAQEIMQTMYNLAKEGAALNFLTDQVDYQLAKNHHFSVVDVTRWATQLTRSFVLYNDYPLWEFTLKLLKER